MSDLSDTQTVCCARLHTPRCLTALLVVCTVVQSMIATGLISAVLSTLAVRYGLSTTLASVLPVAQDIMNILIVTLLAVHGGNGNKHRWLAGSLMAMSAGTLLFGSVQFMGSYYSSASTSDAFCSLVAPVVSAATCSSSLQFYPVLIIGQALIAIGGTALYALAPPALADCVEPGSLNTHLGCLFASAAVGPAAGFMMAGAFLGTWVDATSAPPVGLSTTSTSWVGNWWLGYLIAGALAAVTAAPLFTYPKYLPDTEAIRAATAAESPAAEESDSKAQPATSDSAATTTAITAPLPADHAELSWHSLRFLFGTAPFSFAIAACTFDAFAVASYSAFLPLVLQYTFGISASDASFYIGVALILGAAGGIAFFCFLADYKALSAKQVAALMATLSLISTFTIPSLLLRCDSAPFVGVSTTTALLPTLGGGGGSFTAACNFPCNCSLTSAQPVCGADGLTYASACFAGCTGALDTLSQTFANCSCTLNSIAAGSALKMHEAAPGNCVNADCSLLPAYLIAVFFVCFFLFGNTGIFANFLMHTVPHDYRPLGIGLQNLVYRVFGSIPGPIVFGRLVDSACKSFGQSCDGSQGACISYDAPTLAVITVLVGVVCKVLATACYYFAYKTYPDAPDGDHTDALDATTVSLTDVSSHSAAAVQALDVHSPLFAFASSSASSPITAGAVFKRPLTELVGDATVCDADDGVPLFLKAACAFLLQPQHAAQVGLFRVSGQKDDVDALRARFTAGEHALDLGAYSPHAVAGVVKQFLRELPNPLLTFEQYDAFLDAHRRGCTADSITLVAALPAAHRGCAQFLFRFLARVTAHEATNKMSAANLAIVFAPNVLRARVETLDSIARDTPAAIAIVTALIEAADAETAGNDLEVTAPTAVSTPRRDSPTLHSERPTSRLVDVLRPRRKRSQSPHDRERNADISQ